MTVSDLVTNGSLVTTCIDVLHDSRKQFQNLAMEVACIVWAQALLDDVYYFITKETERLGEPPFQIPQFRFVESALSTYNFSKISYCVINFLITRLWYQAENEP